MSHSLQSMKRGVRFCKLLGVHTLYPGKVRNVIVLTPAFHSQMLLRNPGKAELTTASYAVIATSDHCRSPVICACRQRLLVDLLACKPSLASLAECNVVTSSSCTSAICCQSPLGRPFRGLLSSSTGTRGHIDSRWLENVDICTDTYPYIDTKKIHRYIHKYVKIKCSEETLNLVEPKWYSPVKEALLKRHTGKYIFEFKPCKDQSLNILIRIQTLRRGHLAACNLDLSCSRHSRIKLE